MKRVALAVCVSVILPFCAGCADKALRAEYDRLKADYDASQTIYADSLKEMEALKERLMWREHEVEELKLKLQEYQALGDLGEEFRKALEALRGQLGEGVTEIPGGLRIEEAVLFEPGSAEIRAKGKEILQKLAPELKREGIYFTIIGHTDSDPIKKTAGVWRTKTNRELSLYRALNVWIVLKDEGIDQSRVICAGMGEHHPIAPNDTVENKRKNRRVEIILLQKPAFDALMPGK